GVNGDGVLLIVEIKSSVADFRADHKWRDYFAHCDRLYFAVDSDMPLAVMPDEAGLIVADSYGGEILREPPARAIPPAARRAVLLRFALAAADRLHRLADPGAAPET
ncbi:MAG: MmcB family DNA repair protein, partial [Roseiarcus sp.]